jgi:hypothetical protein
MVLVNGDGWWFPLAIGKQLRVTKSTQIALLTAKYLLILSENSKGTDVLQHTDASHHFLGRTLGLFKLRGSDLSYMLSNRVNN